MSHTSFLGIPVEGEITKTEVRAAQRPLADFEPLIRALLDDDEIIEFGWRQYTPYFNDGEPCVFGAHGVWVRTTADKDADREDEQLDVEYGHPSLGKFKYSYHGTYPREKRVESYEGPDRARLERCVALSDAIDGGAFDDVLIEAFGDHADIAITRAGITVEFYEHD